MAQEVTLAVIGGSGLYEMDEMKVEREVNPDTPWGKPSDSIVIGNLDGILVAFLARHGKGHFLNPTEIPVRANMAALKSLGVQHILSFSAVGSLREEIAPEHFVLPTQIIDRTKGIRPSTFFEEGAVAHAMFGDPFSESIASIVKKHAPAALDVPLHTDKTLVCMEGPAFSTRAESMMYRSLNADIINMSVLPEAKLAREAEINYQMVCMSTDYDSWREEEESVTVEQILGFLKSNAARARKLARACIPDLAKIENPLIGTMQHGIITAPDRRGKVAMERLKYLFPNLS
ncbi:MAG: S-methyl-5'-thioadenosine phosphorylase [Leptospiraceae bacterium]|nr:S-methyl-5'-thioadenosine phosphorylase [Leptospiraceae bacterium]MCB1303744.1 S-methyl-5'-thioadenosine phosphorylase [Leptospiraceae bacterium]